jgi:uncharacterized membrane protein
MHRVLRTSLKGWLLLALATGLIFALWWGFEGRHEGLTLIIDDESISFGANSAEGLALSLGGLVFAVLFCVVVVPIVLTVALGVPALVLAGALAIGLVVLAVVLGTLLSPLLLPLLLVWWLLRRDRRRAAAGSTTIQA